MTAYSGTPKYPTERVADAETARDIVNKQADALTELAWADMIPDHIRKLMWEQWEAALTAARADERKSIVAWLDQPQWEDESLNAYLGRKLCASRLERGDHTTPAGGTNG